MKRPALAMLALMAWAGPSMAAPKVVVSLKPIHALAAAIMDGVAQPTLIVEGAASEHFYVLRPSEAAALEGADAVFWVGPSMESYLIKPLATLPRRARITALMDQPGLTRLSIRDGGPFGHEHEAHGKSAGFDGHLWLDPENAKLMAEAILAVLSALDPAHAAAYATNHARLSAELDALDAELRRRFAPLRKTPFIVFHDAYQYLERRYGLDVVGTVTLDPTLSASAHRVIELRARIKETGAACVFSEPQFEPKLVRVLIEGTPARTGVLDPMGADLPPGRAAYFTLMRNLASALEACLEP